MIHFIVIQKKNVLLITNHDLSKIREQYGSNFELVNSLRDVEHLDTIKQRVVRQYPRHEIVEQIKKKRAPINFTPEVREKLRQSKLGKKRDEETKKKISLKMKGTSNFQGKTHSDVSKRKTAMSMRGNKNINGKKWVYNPRTDKENRIENRNRIASGYRLGRDPENVGFFNF